MINMDLTHSTVNPTQYSVIIYMGNESKKMDITESLCCMLKLMPLHSNIKL